MTHPAIRRQQAAQLVLDRFNGKPLDYACSDCGRMAAALLKAMGHNARWSRFSGYKTERGARRALVRNKFRDLPAVLDDLGLPRIPFAMAMQGDLVGFPDENDWTALGVAMGNGRFLAGASDGVFRVGSLEPALMDRAIAWRVEPR
jgi:hypothetical protein